VAYPSSAAPRQNDEPLELEIASADKVAPSTDLMQQAWNRLIEDRDHES
jgi:hypothetical protein